MISPRDGDRATINAYLERHYNTDAPAAQYVPYTIWERGGRRTMPDPDWGGAPGRSDAVPAATRDIVFSHLRAMAGCETIRDTDHLANDLNLDSLARAELLTWMEAEFGFSQGNTDSVQTVADLLLAACGEVTAADAHAVIKPVAKSWFTDTDDAVVSVPEGKTIAACFLASARRDPRRVVVADQTSGVRTFRECILGVMALLPTVTALPGERVGIMLPASVAACLAYLTTLFAGRTPVMVNWTVGRRNMLHALESTGTQRVITVRALVTRLQEQGVNLSGLEERFVYLETVMAGLTKAQKLQALLASYCGWGVLRRAKISPTAAILFTSGSESLPKAVPLSHANLLADLRGVLPMVKLKRGDRMLAMLPPFHSFGLTGNIVLPLTTGLRAVYHANPTQGSLLAQIIAAYRANMLLGTPTFLNGILRRAPMAQLASLTLAVVGAEECPQRVYDLMRERCPHAVLLEGYGITECSPIVAINLPENPHPHTIGRLLPTLEHVLLDAETGQPVSAGKPGALLLRGPSIFDGYLDEASDPFVDFDGKRWYRTGDLATQLDDGTLVFAGRLKRFVKLGGEMIPLPAIESVLQSSYGSVEDDGPILAVVATSDERPELVLYTVKAIDRAAANAVLRAAGLSALHNLRRVEQIPAIPALGAGKIDYRALQALLAASVEEAGTHD